VPVSKSYAGLKIDADAAAAGAGKATIYDWWPTKAKRAIDAFFHRTGPDL
jgi:AcrR family transcriptional regulator